MPTRLRSLIGTIAIIFLVIVYAILTTALASAALAHFPWGVHLAYFFLTGILWIMPAMTIIRWMAGSKKHK